MPDFGKAIQDFQRARRKADLQQIMARLMGRTADLLSYEEVQRKLKPYGKVVRGLQDVPLDAIVGSVGRYRDFTRTFLPKDNAIQQRWANLLALNVEGRGLPPIELYKVGEAYFVLDGNHRVSIAREQGFKTIQAHVTEVLTNVPLNPNDSPDDLIIKEQYADFLERTSLHKTRPEADLLTTAPGKYDLIEEQIAIFIYHLEQKLQREIDWKEGAKRWYDESYLPTVHLIRERGILRDFPNRTETDLYAWLAEQSQYIEEALGWNVYPVEAVAALSEKIWGEKVPSRMWWPSSMENDALNIARQEWGGEEGKRPRRSRLFKYVLVSVGEDELSWEALKQARLVAEREEGVLRALHIVTAESDREAIQQKFDEITQDIQITASLAFDSGSFYQQFSERARWNDLVAMSVANPPGEGVFGRLQSGWRNVVIRSPRPILAVPGQMTPMMRALLAYDGSSKAEEALYIAAYLADQWGTLLTVLSVGAGEVETPIIEKARAYLEDQEVTADYITATGHVGKVILATAEQRNCDLLLLGSYGSKPVVELVVGSTVDSLLRHAKQPMLICR